jgi:thioredoxin-related protein
MKKIILLLLCLTPSLISIAQDSINFISLRESNLEKIKLMAKKENKPILLYFTSNVCGICIKMEHDFFHDRDVVDVYNKSFICAKSKTIFVGNRMKSKDYEKLNRELFVYDKKFDVTANPTFIVINAGGDIIHRTEGYKDKQSFLRFVNDALSQDKSYIELKMKVHNGDYSFETVKMYLECIQPAQRYMDNEYKCEAQEVLDNYFKTQNEKDYISKNNWYLINTSVDNPKSKPFDYLLKNQDAFISIYGEQEVNKRIFHVLRTYAYAGNRSSKRYKVANKEIETLTYPQAIALVKYYLLQNEKDLNSYAIEIDKIFTKYYYIFDYEINNQAWVIYETSNKENSNINVKTLEIASKWMELIVKLNPENKYFEDTDIKIKERLIKLKE